MTIAMEGFLSMTPRSEAGEIKSGWNMAGQSLSCRMHSLFPSKRSRKLRRNPTLGKSQP